MRTLLVHGLGRTPASLALLGWAMKRAGHQPEYLAYFAFAETYEQIRQRLVARLQELAASPEPVALLGHSLGGLLLRHAIAEVPNLRVHQLIMLGTPNRAPRRAREAVRWLPFRLFARTCGEVLASADFYQELPAPAVPYTIIAGTGGHRLLAGPFGLEPHDGFVAVAETPIRDTDRPILLPVAHTFMMNDPALQKLVLALLDASPRKTSA